jgi:hypothetical protein
MPNPNDPRLRLLANAPPLGPEPEQAVAPPLATAWTLTKYGHRAVCTIHAHPLGVEVRLDLDGELHRRLTRRCTLPVRELPADVLIFVADWRNKWAAKGWIVPTPIEPAEPKPERAK